MVRLRNRYCRRDVPPWIPNPAFRECGLYHRSLRPGRDRGTSAVILTSFLCYTSLRLEAGRPAILPSHLRQQGDQDGLRGSRQLPALVKTVERRQGRALALLPER